MKSQLDSSASLSTPGLSLHSSASLSTPGLLLGKILDVTSTPFGPSSPAASASVPRREFSSLQEQWSASTFSTLERSDALVPVASLTRDDQKENRRPVLATRTSLGSDTATTLKRKNLIEDSNWLSLERKKNPRGGELDETVKHARPLSNSPSPTGYREEPQRQGRDSSSAATRRFAELLPDSMASQSDLSETLKRISDPTVASRRSRSRSGGDEDNDAESQHGEDFGDLSRARSFWKNLDTETVRKASVETVRKASVDSGTLSRRQSHDVSRPLRAAAAVSAANKASSQLLQQKPTRPERKNSAVSLADSSHAQSSTGSWRGRPEPLPDYEDGYPLESKSLVTSRRDEERRSRSLEKKFSTVGSSTSGRKDSLSRPAERKQDGVGRKLSTGGANSLPRTGVAMRRASVLSDAPSYERAKSPDYDRGARRESISAERSRHNSRDLSGDARRGSMVMDVDYNRGRRDYPVAKRLSGSGGWVDDFGPKELVATGRPGSGVGGESKHFLSLQIFSKHAEPALEEFLPVKMQQELEHKQREEEDALYRKFLQERREQEEVVIRMEDEEREELFNNMNKMERSRIINLADKHCAQMMDLIYREKIRYLEEGGEETADIKAKYPREPPEIAPAQFTKDQVYENNMAVFEVVDEAAKQAAKENYRTFTSLVRFLVGRCSSDLDKARAIFKYITEKEFEHQNWFLFYPEEGNTRGAPSSLLRGVEFGIETKALLYKRMCAYAGLHAIVIKGYCKARDYMPGDEFNNNRWRNAWNAVYVAGGWRLVQPNWAAMQVNTKAARETRKIYQDHYFLADPDKFIFEFFPMAAEHQFLEHPITRSEFETLPLLRSTFFHYGLGLARSEGLLQAVVNTDNRGEANIYLNSQGDVSFHYTLMNFKNGSTSVKAPGGKFPLGRFVMMSTKDEETTFNIHIPQKGTYLLEIGAAKYPTAEESLAKKPVFYINVCKFKIVCKSVDKLMVPLPDCVPGEWGPNKAMKLFGLKATSHPLPVIYAAPPSYVDLRQETRPLTLNIEFEKTRPVLDFVTKLYKNGVGEEELRQGARYRNKDNYIIFDIKVPQDGQYGLDIYTREKWEDKMLHCCKYLINCDM